MSGSSYQLTDATRGNSSIYDANNSTSTSRGTLFTDADNVWGNGSTSSRQSAAVDAAYGAANTWDFFKGTFGRNGIRNDGVAAYSRVHYGNSYENAFWSDSCFCMTYGDGGTSFSALVSLDVAGHEMTTVSRRTRRGSTTAVRVVGSTRRRPTSSAPWSSSPPTTRATPVTTTSAKSSPRTAPICAEWTTRASTEAA